MAGVIPLPPTAWHHAGRGRPGFRRVPGLSFPVLCDGGRSPGPLELSTHTPEPPRKDLPGLFIFAEGGGERKEQPNSENPEEPLGPCPVVQIRKLRHGEAEGRGSGSCWAARRLRGAPRGRCLLAQPLRQCGAFFVFRGHHDYGSRLARAAPPPPAAGWISPRRGQRGTQQGGGRRGEESGLHSAPERGTAREGPRLVRGHTATDWQGAGLARPGGPHPRGLSVTAQPQSPLQANGRAVQGEPCKRSGCGDPDF